MAFIGLLAWTTFSYDLGDQRRLFAKITPTIQAGGRDPMLNCPILQLETLTEERIIGLPAILPDNVYALPVSEVTESSQPLRIIPDTPESLLWVDYADILFL